MRSQKYHLFCRIFGRLLDCSVSRPDLLKDSLSFLILWLGCGVSTPSSSNQTCSVDWLTQQWVSVWPLSVYIWVSDWLEDSTHSLKFSYLIQFTLFEKAAFMVIPLSFYLYFYLYFAYSDEGDCHLNFILSDPDLS